VAAVCEEVGGDGAEGGGVKGVEWLWWWRHDGFVCGEGGGHVFVVVAACAAGVGGDRVERGCDNFGGEFDGRLGYLVMWSGGW